MANDLRYENVTMRFEGRAGAVQALDPFEFHVDASEFLVIVGPSGCGKSTLLHLTAGLYKPPTGRILLGGEEIRDPGPDKAIVFQSFSLFPWKTVHGNIDFGLRINGMPEVERKEQIARAIRLIGLDGFENHYPRQLSGGMQQRVAIARSFVLKPRAHADGRTVRGSGCAEPPADAGRASPHLADAAPDSALCHAQR